MPIASSDFAGGGLRRDSNVRPDRLFTADSRLIIYRAGTLARTKLDEIVNAVVTLITQ
jgi:mRNA interferase MazF